MELKTYLAGLDVAAREAFATACGTTAGHMRNVMYGQKRCATDLAVRIERQSRGAVTRRELREDWPDHWPELVTKDHPAPEAAPQANASAGA
jgi:DNA-binding transcriptional regulator YdaS (Cro superfamily)